MIIINRVVLTNGLTEGCWESRDLKQETLPGLYLKYVWSVCVFVSCYDANHKERCVLIRVCQSHRLWRQRTALEAQVRLCGGSGLLALASSDVVTDQGGTRNNLMSRLEEDFRQ